MQKFHCNTGIKRACTMMLSVLLIVSLLIPLGCTNTTSTSTTNTNDAKAGSADQKTNPALDNAPYDPYNEKDGTWAIYWYLCGSDIELRTKVSYAATGQVQEMLKVTLPDNVTVVIAAGGAKKWHLEGIDPNYINYLVYQGDTLTVTDTKALASMGDPQTFADFLAYCNQNYPAEHQVVILYDHGGGSLYGIAFDDLFDSDALTLPEINDVIQSRPAASGIYELIGLDACLMSTIDAVAVFNGQAKYLVASEEVILACAWDYEKICAAIANNRDIDGAELGKVIADSHYAQCVENEYTGWTTISVIDLAYADELLAAYNDVGIELLQGAVENGSEYVAALGRAAYASENYGAINNNPTSTFDLVDLGHLVINARDLLPKSADQMLRAIEKSMAYHVNNPLRAEGLGISCYYPYTGSQRSFDLFGMLNTSPAWKYYYEYISVGSVSPDGQAYLASLSTTPVPEPEPLPDPSELGLDGLGLEVYRNTTYWMEVGDKKDYVAAVYLRVGAYVFGMGTFVQFGTRDRVYGNWEDGTFYDQFDERWGCLDGVLCYMVAVSRTENTVLYRVPVWHNGVQKDMMVLHTETDPYKREGYYEILGLISQTPLQSNAPEIVFEKLEVGDTVAPYLLFYSQEMVRNNDFSSPGAPSYITPEEAMLNAITVTEDTSFYDKILGDGFYMIAFEIIDYTGTSHFSQIGFYSVKDGFVEPTDLEQMYASFPG